MHKTFDHIFYIFFDPRLYFLGSLFDKKPGRNEKRPACRASHVGIRFASARGAAFGPQAFTGARVGSPLGPCPQEGPLLAPQA